MGVKAADQMRRMDFRRVGGQVTGTGAVFATADVINFVGESVKTAGVKTWLALRESCESCGLASSV